MAKATYNAEIYPTEIRRICEWYAWSGYLFPVSCTKSLPSSTINNTLQSTTLHLHPPHLRPQVNKLGIDKTGALGPESRQRAVPTLVQRARQSYAATLRSGELAIAAKVDGERY